MNGWQWLDATPGAAAVVGTLLVIAAVTVIAAVIEHRAGIAESLGWALDGLVLALGLVACVLLTPFALLYEGWRLARLYVREFRAGRWP